MARIVAICALSVALTGCGTVQNFQRESASDAEVYGGVRLAVEKYERSPKHNWILPSPAKPIAALDIPLSAVGDTLTLPVTATLAARRLGVVLWALATYENTNSTPNEWRQFWYGDQSGHLTPERIHGGIY